MYTIMFYQFDNNECTFCIEELISVYVCYTCVSNIFTIGNVSCLCVVCVCVCV